MGAGTFVRRTLIAAAMGNALFAAASTYLANTPGAAMQSVTLTNGDQLTSSTIDVPTLPASAGTPIFHLDASSTNGWTFAVSGGTNYVTKCPSATGDGRYLTFDSNGGTWLNGPFLRESDPELKGGRTLDFGKQGSRLGLYFDGGKLDNIGTIVAVWGSQNGGGWILGGGAWTNSEGSPLVGFGFHRGSNPANNSDNEIVAASRIIKSPAYPAAVAGRCWLDGTEVSPVDMGLSGNYQLLSIVCTNLVPWAAGLGINDTRNSTRSGGQRVAEMIIYGKLLSDEERRSVEAYLTEKWFGRPYAGYNHHSALAEARLSEMCEVAVPQDETLSVTRVRDGGSPKRTAPIRQTVKSGTGTLEMADAAGLGRPFLWQAGGLSFPRRAVPAALPADPVFRMDASAASSLDTVVDGGGVTRVTAWRDADGRGFAAAPLAETNRPSLLANALNGKAVVDFGAYAGGQFLQWNTNMSYIGTVLWVVGSQNGGGHLMGHSWDNGCQFQRGGAGGAQASPIWSSAGSKVAMRACPTYVNGLRVNGTNACLGCAYQVVAVQAPGAYANQFAGHLSTSSDSSRTGGQRLAEVVAYNRLLSDQELADAQAYLMRKWLSADAPGYARQSRARPDLQDVSVACEGPLTVGSDAVRLGAVSGTGTILKRGAGDLELQDSSLFLGSITLESGSLKTASPAVVDDTPADEPAFHLDATRADTLETLSQNGTNFIAQWTDVSGWRNAARRYDTSASRPLPWLRTDAPANGHPVVDFGPRASCRVLVFDKPVNHIRAAYIVIGTQGGCGNFLLGSSGVDVCDFHRGGDDLLDSSSRPILGGFDFSQPLRDGLIYVDGVQTNYNAGLSGGYQVVEFHPAAGMRASALACDRYGGTTDVGNLGNESARRTGGQRLGEVVLYDRPLSERERAATRNYLMKKWLNRAPAALPADPTNALRQIALATSSNVIFCAGNAASVLSLTGAGDFEKTGAASLAIVDASAFTGTLRVAEGVLALTGRQPPYTPELATNGLTFHADATKNVEWALEGGVRRVSRWGSAVGDGWFAYPQVNKPEYRLADLGGLPVVDLGPMGSLRHLLFCNTNSAVGATNRIANIRSVFWVMGSQNGGGYLLGGGTNASNAAAHYNFHRGPKMGSNDVVNPITPDHYLWGGPADPKIKDATSITYLNGVATNGSQTVLSGGYDLIGLVMNQYATEAEGFAFDGRYLDSRAFGERSGGQRLAEVLIYNRPLSDAERRGIECYLQRKWALLPYRAHDGSAMTLSVAAGASVDLAGSTQPVAHLTGSGAVTGGTLQVLEGISVGESEGQAGTLAVTGGLTLADGAVMDVDIDPPNADRVTVSGNCALGANVTVHLHHADSVRGRSVYQTPLIEAGALADASNVSGWTVAGELPKGYRATLCAADNKVWLRLSLQGFLMLVK